MKHTPGPWYFLGDTVHGPGAIRVATIRRQKKDDNLEKFVANGHLVEAAPELLKELTEAHRIIHTMLNMMNDEQKGDLAKLDVDGHGAVRYHTRKDAITKAGGAV